MLVERWIYAAVVLVCLFAGVRPAGAMQGCHTLVLGGLEAGEGGSLVTVDPLAGLISNYTSYRREQLYLAVYTALPEVGWLSSKVTATPADKKCQAHPDSPSLMLQKSGFELGGSSVAGQPRGFHPEIDRTLVSLYILQLWLKNDYEGFVKAQRTEAPKAMPVISRERFEHWRRFFIELLAKDASWAAQALAAPSLPPALWTNTERFRALIVWMVIHDLGKSKDWAEAAVAAKAEVSHDSIIVRGLQERPFMAPSFAALRSADAGDGVESYKSIILKGIEAEFNLGQDVQMEAPDAMLGRIIGMDALTQKMYLAHLILDVAGAHAVVDPNGARLFHAGIDKSYTLGARNMERVVGGEAVRKVRWDFVKERVADFGMQVETEEDYLMGIVVLYCRSQNAEQAQTSVKAFHALSVEDQRTLRREMLAGGIHDGWATLLEYGPQTIDNQVKQMTVAKVPDAGVEGRKKALRAVARAYRQLRTEVLDLRTGNGMLHVNINAIAAAPLEDPPKDLDQVGFDFLVDGNDVSVTLIRPPSKP